MNEIIYLEPDDDITSVIGRIKEIAPDAVSLVIPRGGNIAQSIVNLKLLKREIEKIDKTVSLVANDKISKNLASQVGITVYGTVQEAKSAKPMAAAAESAAYAGSIKINRYNRDDEEGALDQVEEDVVGETEEEIRPPVESKKPEEPMAKIEAPIKETPPPVRAERPIKHIGTHAGTEAAVGSKFRSRNVSSRKKPIIIIASIAVVVALAMSVIFLPKADASIVLKTEDIKADSTIIIDKNIVNVDQNAGAIPGKLIFAEDELSKDFNATGSKNAGTKATGQVVFYNYDYQDTNPKTIPSGTTLVASGKNFTTTASVTIPGASATIVQGAIKVSPSVSSKIGITASDAGEEYNLPAGRFDISGYSAAQRQLVYAQTDTALTGGTTKKITIVSDDDLKKAKDEVQNELNQNIGKKLTDQAGIDKKLVVSGQSKITNNSAEASKKSGDEASTFSYKISAKGETLAYTESQMREMIAVKVSANLPADQMLVNPDKTAINFEVKDANYDTGKFTLLDHFDGKKGKKYDAGVIQKNITNQKYGIALSSIKNLDGVESVSLNVWPKFIPRTPLIKSRVNVKFDYSQ